MAGTTAGNAAILSYTLYWDNGSGTPNIALLDSLVTTFTVTGLTEGATYLFTVRASNIYGHGASSNQVAILAATTPDVMAAPTTALSANAIVVAWAVPGTGGLPIDRYQILILNEGNSTFVEDTTQCDGSSSTVMSALSCSFPLTYLISTYSYSLGDLVKFQVRAHNADGWGSISSPNQAGATVVAVPVQMDAPLGGSATSSVQIAVTWTSLTTIA